MSGADGRPDAAAFIARHLPLAPVPGVPGIRLHQATPASGLHRLLGEGAGPPYWAYRWGGGLALGRYLADHPEAVRGRSVLDCGAGSGLVAIAAARAGATSVEAVEVDAQAIVAVALNAAANGVALTSRHADPLDGPAPDAAVVLVGDLFYDEALGKRTAAFCQRCRAAGATVLIGDPYRAPLPLHQLAPLATYEVEETAGRPKPAGVFAWL